MRVLFHNSDFLFWFEKGNRKSLGDFQFSFSIWKWKLDNRTQFSDFHLSFGIENQKIEPIFFIYFCHGLATGLRGYTFELRLLLLWVIYLKKLRFFIFYLFIHLFMCLFIHLFICSFKGIWLRVSVLLIVWSDNITYFYTIIEECCLTFF